MKISYERYSQHRTVYWDNVEGQVGKHQTDEKMRSGVYVHCTDR